VEPDLEVLDSEAKRLYEASDGAVALRAQLESETEAMKELLAALKDMLREMAGWEEQYGVAARIADVASGKKPNKLGMNFETFILASMLDKVAEAATRRLQVMSKGRYSLRRTLDRRTARSAGGAWPGGLRHVHRPGAQRDHAFRRRRVHGLALVGVRAGRRSAVLRWRHPP
jgi:exonuclease SbcC